MGGSLREVRLHFFPVPTNFVSSWSVRIVHKYKTSLIVLLSFSPPQTAETGRLRSGGEACFLLRPTREVDVLSSDVQRSVVSFLPC